MNTLIGQKFGKLTIIDGPIRINKHTYYDCQCECGNITRSRLDGLKAGKTISCGCHKNQILIENNKKRQSLNLTNQRFGKLVALYPIDKRKEGRVVWVCQCDCGNLCEVDTHNLQQGKVKSCGCLRSNGEFIIEQLLLQNNISFQREKQFTTCRFDNNYMAKFDFYVNNNYIIEFDGQQHFKPTSIAGWNTPDNVKIVQQHDQIKNEWCKNNNIPLIRIPYTALSELTINDLLLETSKWRIL